MCKELLQLQSVLQIVRLTDMQHPKGGFPQRVKTSLISSKDKLLILKAESHCSDNENNNDQDAKRTHSIG